MKSKTNIIPDLNFIKTRILHYIIWLLIITLYSPAFYQLYSSRWRIIDYTHAYFILPASLWLVWNKRRMLTAPDEKIKPSADFSGLFLFIAGIAMFIFGWRQDYLLVSTLSLIPLLFGIIIYLYGTKTAKILSFPVSYLLLLVPPPLGIIDTFTLPMRYGISFFTEKILKLLRFPIERSGLLLSISGHEIFMGQPCSGLRSLVTMAALGLIFVYISKGNLKKKSILLSMIIPLALTGNLVRVVSMCVFTYYYGDSHAQKLFHDYSGIIIFIITIFGLIKLESFLEKHADKNLTE